MSFNCSKNSTKILGMEILGVAMDGTMLPPFTIFKGRGGGRVINKFPADNFPQDSLYAVQDKAWVDKRVFLEWVEKVWNPFCTNKPSTYLLMDEFSVHLMTESVHAIQDCGTEVDFIFGGYTSKIQVLDVGINKPFKDYTKRCNEHYRVENESSMRVKRMDVSKWIDESWKRVSKQAIYNTLSFIEFTNLN